MPAKLSSDTVCYCSYKLTTKTKIRAQPKSKLFWIILRLWDIPFKLIDKRDVTNMDVKLKENKNKVKQWFGIVQKTSEHLMCANEHRIVFSVIWCLPPKSLHRDLKVVIFIWIWGFSAWYAERNIKNNIKKYRI